MDKNSDKKATKKKTSPGGVKKSRNGNKKLFSKKKVEIKRKLTRKRTPKEIAILVGKVFLTFLLIMVILGSIGITLLTFMVTKAGLTGSLDLRNLELAYSTIFYSEDAKNPGQYIEVDRVHGSENRVWVDFENTPKQIVDAVVAVEDQRFFAHGGVDWKRTTAAFVNMFLPLYDSNQGGSTITQQLIKNITNEKESSGIAGITRKTKEIVRALAVESKFSKEDILEAYLNTFPVSNNTAGVQAAANLYFNKDVSQLSLAECASIAGVTKSPVKYNPLKNPEKNKERQEHILSLMLEQGKITQEEYDAAVKEVLVFANSDETQADNKNSITSYFIDAVMDDVISDLMKEYNYSKSDATQYLLKGGLRIYTTMDPNVQNSMETVFENEKNYQTYRGLKVQPQAAMLVMDYSGGVKGIIGGRGEKTDSRGLNRATQSPRPIGSTMKPIGVYGPAIDNNTITWSTMIVDQPLLINNGGTMEEFPHNYNLIQSGKPTLVVNALERSVNTVPFRIGQMLTEDYIYNFLQQRLGITTLVDVKQVENRVLTDKALAPLTLGSLTDGITVEELTGAYQIFGNGGVYNTPHTYTKVVDNSGKTILEPKITVSQAISKESAGVMNKLLQNVCTGPQGTGRTATFGWQMAGKTGTSFDNKDQWWVGLTPYYVGACWVGCDTPAELPLQGRHPAIDLWKNSMSKIHSKLQKKTFTDYGGAVNANYCVDSGELAGAGCTNIAEGWYKPDNKPGICTVHSAAPKE